MQSWADHDWTGHNNVKGILTWDKSLVEGVKIPQISVDPDSPAQIQSLKWYFQHDLTHKRKKKCFFHILTNAYGVAKLWMWQSVCEEKFIFPRIFSTLALS